MADTPAANGHAPEVAKVGPRPKSELVTPNAQPRKRLPKKKGPNYNQIHNRALPLATHPLPAFHPTNPISLLRLAYTYIYQFLAPPSSHPTKLYVGYFSYETRSVLVTDSQHIRALWEMGFFGKGTLSRSEPSWLEREKARLKAKRAGGGTAEEATNARREKRRLFKLERARAEAEKIQRQRLVEEGKLDAMEVEVAVTAIDAEISSTMQNKELQPPSAAAEASDLADEEVEIDNQEVLQLTMEEAFFLSYGLGVLEVRDYQDSELYATTDLLTIFANHSFFPPRTLAVATSPDDPFILSYVTYHHFRSLGWVIRPGIKFAVDYLLYLRGPVFAHAEFAIIIMPSYSDTYWSSSEGLSCRRMKEGEQKDWWWLHCVNRVQSQVLKNLVLVYVDIPAASHFDDNCQDVGKLLGSYKVREFVLKRWVANRSRD